MDLAITSRVCVVLIRHRYNGIARAAILPRVLGTSYLKIALCGVISTHDLEGGPFDLSHLSRSPQVDHPQRGDSPRQTVHSVTEHLGVLLYFCLVVIDGIPIMKLVREVQIGADGMEPGQIREGLPDSVLRY